jgi:hypothetical protein
VVSAQQGESVGTAHCGKCLKSGAVEALPEPKHKTQIPIYNQHSTGVHEVSLKIPVSSGAVCGTSPTKWVLGCLRTITGRA